MKALGLPLYIVGGTARDFSRAILGTDKPARVTTDLDVAIAIRDWSVFDRISAELERRQFLIKLDAWNDRHIKTDKDAYQIIRRALNDFASILKRKTTP